MQKTILTIQEAAALVNVSSPFFNSNILKIDGGNLEQAKRAANKFFNQYNQVIDYLIFRNLLFIKINKKSPYSWQAGKWH
jgi:hypothetical protein